MIQRRRLAVVLALSGLFGLLAVAGKIQAQGTDAPVATVNGEAIPASEFLDRVQKVRAQDFIVSVNPLSVKSATAGQILLDQMINERLTLQWAGKTNQMPTDAEITSDLNKVKAQPAIAQALASHQMTEDFLKYGLRYQKARFNLATTSVSVSPDEVEKYYQAHLANYSVPERWALLALSTRKQADLAKIQTELKAGKPFAEVAKAYSDDPNVQKQGGDLGVLNSNDPNLPLPIREAVKNLKDGQTSSPIKLESDPGGGKPKIAVWWILRLTKREAGVTRPFAEVKAQVEQTALLERAGGIQVADKKIADFRQVSDIKINLPGYEILLPVRKKP